MVSLDPAVIDPSGAITSVPATVGVVPTASLGKLIPTNCSVTRYEAEDPSMISRCAPAVGGVGAGGGPCRGGPPAGACAVSTDPLPITNAPAITSPSTPVNETLLPHTTHFKSIDSTPPKI